MLPEPVVVKLKLLDDRGPVTVNVKVPCAPEKVPVPPEMVAVPEIDVAEVGVTVEEADQVLPSPNLTTKETATAPAPPPPPVTEMVVGP